MTLIVTQAGLDKAVQAGISGVSLTIAEVAIGANGYEPNKDMTALQNETIRKQLTGGKKVASNQIQLQVLIDDAGEVIGREIGFYLDDGTLFAIDSHPTNIITYKSASQGSKALETFDLILDSVPPNSVAVSILGNMTIHEEDPNPHPQYVPSVPVVDLPFDSNIVNKLSGSLKFSRASTTGNINKSGISETLAVDEPAITSDGLSVYESYENIHPFSETLDANASLSRCAIAEVFPSFGVNKVFELEATGDIAYFNQGTNAIYVSGEVYTAQAFVKKGTGGDARVLLHQDAFAENISATLNFSSGAVSASGPFTGFNAKYIGDGWYKLWVSGIAAITGIGRSAYFWPVSNNITGKTWLVSGHSLTKTRTHVPYVKTTTVPVTRAADIATIPAMNNIPATGKPFTILCEVAIPSDGEPVGLWSIPSSTAGGIIILRRDSGGYVRFHYDTSTGDDFSVSFALDTNKHVLTCTFDGDEVKVFADGALAASGSTGGDVCATDHSGEIKIGLWLNDNLNSEIKKFEIYHRALSAEEIAAKGGPK